MLVMAGSAVSIMSARPAAAITGTVDANAAAINGNVKLAGLVNIPLLNVAGVNSAGGPVTGGLPTLNVLNTIVVGAITTAADGDPLADTSSASTAVAALNLAGLLTLNAVTASCSTAAPGAVPTGSAVVVGLGLLSGLTPTTPIPAAAAPANTDIPIALLGLTVGHLYLNTQTVTTVGNVRTLSVDALRLSINALGLAQVDVTIGHVDCSTTGPSAPTVTAVTPNQGPQAGGGTVTVDGTNFLGISQVVIGGNPATFTPVSQTRLTAVLPSHPPGTVDVQVTNLAATSATSAAAKYTYFAIPTVTSLSPSSGPETGGTTVTITGTALTGTTAVTVGSTPATGVVVVNATTVTAVVPAGTGTRSVTVTTPGGTSATGAGSTWTYVPAPTLTALSPTSGAATGGTTVTLTGTNFTATSQVTLDGASLAATYLSPASLQITTPAHAAGAVPVSVTTVGGTTGALTFTYLAVPTVSGLAPDFGTTLGGTSVTVTGTGLGSVTGVTVDGLAATVTAQSATSLTLTTPAHAAGAVAVTLTGPEAITTAAGAYTYVTPGQPGPHDPTVTTLTPGGGPLAGGTTVTVTGTNLTGATAVTFGGLPATGVSVSSATRLTAVAPAGAAAGPVAVRVTTPVATSAITAGSIYVYEPPAPTLASVSPAHGPDTGGTTVTLTGSDFSPAGSVLVDGSVVPSTFVDAGHLTVTVPAHVAGPVGVQVQTTPALQSAVRTYTYDPTPTVTAMNPTAGPTGGGTTVTVTGTHLDTVTHVDVDGTDVAPASASTSTLTFSTPPHAPGSVTITLRDAATAGASSFDVTAGTFLYVTPAPSITGVSPAHGPLAGGTSVTVTGTNLTGTSAVTIDGVAATVTGSTPTSVTVTAPASTTPGPAVLSLTTPGGTATGTYTYDPLPTVDGLAPDLGPDTGGTAVTLTGTGFTGVTAVRFGATSGTGLNVLSDTRLTIDSPAHAAGPVHVTVTGPAGTSATSAADGFTFIDTTTVPAVGGVSPNLGTTLGGTQVTITGTGFLGTTGVSFGGGAGTAVTVISDTTLTALTPAHAAGPVHVTVTDPNGTSPTGPGDGFTFVAPASPPAVSAVSPGSGPLAGGTVVTVSGVNFTGATSVRFGAAPGTGLTVAGDTMLTVTSPAGTGPVDVTVTGPGGTSAVTPADRYTYVAAPTIGSMLPAHGPEPGGTTVTITGSGFTGATLVDFGGTPGANLAVATDTSLTVDSPPGSGPVPVTVTAPGGTSASSPFTYDPPPSITALTPLWGTTSGGDSVTVTGSDLGAVTSVDFGGAAATLSAVSATSLTVVTPAHAAGPVDVTVTSPAGTSAVSPASRFTFVLPPPTVTALAPGHGIEAGGTLVTVTGTGFTGATLVDFGGTPGTGVAVSSDTSLTVQSPPGTGPVVVTVTAPGGTSNGAAYTYDPRPAVTGLSPTSGLTTGGEPVTISGTDLAGVATVTFGGVLATIQATTATSVTVLTPIHPPGLVHVRVTSPEGTSDAGPADEFTYVLPAPTITALTPAHGIEPGATQVTITGTGFTGATLVDFGGTPGLNLAVASDTSLTVETPPGTGLVLVTVTAPGGTSNAVTYTYDPPPAITGLSPTSGGVAGGLTVTITGTDLIGVTAVDFGGSPATVQFATATTLTVVTPAHAPGPVDVTATSPTGTSSITPATRFTYLLPAPTVTTLSPTHGVEPGGTVVTITGTGFTGTTQVDFGGTPGTNLAVASDTTLTVESPPGSGLVQVAVTAPGGTGNAATYTYDPPPGITGVIPNSGLTTGGELVTITGTHLTGATSVTFGGTPAAVQIATATTITVLTPPHAAGLVHVQVTTPDGISSSGPADEFTYLRPAPTITALSPTHGPVSGGTLVTITGTGFTGAVDVHFGVLLALNLTVSSDTTLTVESPPGAGSVPVTVTAPGGLSNGSIFTYDLPALPTIAAITPATGPDSGGTTVEITGLGLIQASAVTFDGIAVTGLSVVDDTLVRVVTPPHPAGPAAVSLTTPAGTVSPGLYFAYTSSIPGAPAVTRVDPGRGPAAGGTRVTVSGSGFTGASTVLFGGRPGSELVVLDDGTLSVVSPGGPTGGGRVGVTVVTVGGSSPPDPAAVFEYVLLSGLPTVSGFSPAAGPVAGGTRLTIRGSGFDEFTRVTFDGIPGTNVTITGQTLRRAASSTLTVETPSHPAGPATMVVTNAAGEVTAADRFAFIPLPASSTISVRMVAGSSRTFAPGLPASVGASVTACTPTSGAGTVVRTVGGCTYRAPAAAGADSFVMQMADLIDQPFTRTVQITVVADGGSTTGGGGGNETDGGGGTGGDGGNGTGGDSGNSGVDGGSRPGQDGLAFTGVHAWLTAGLGSGMALIVIGGALIVTGPPRRLALTRRRR